MERQTHPIARSLALAALVLVAAAPSPAQAPGGVCCVAGEYRGSQTPTQLPRCPPPETETFVMTIVQSRGCGAEVSGRISDSGGHVSEYRGRLVRGPRGCCVLTASFSDPGPTGEVVKLTGTLCKSKGTWQATGTYTTTNSGDACKKGGTWEITEM